MKFGPGVIALALATQLTLPVVAAPVGTGSANGSVDCITLNTPAKQTAVPTDATPYRATPLLRGHCTIWHRAEPR